MAYNKVVYDGTTLVDLTADTVDASVLLAGYTAHGKDGNAIVGTFDPLNMFYPVGSYYETSDADFDPNVSFGGTWVKEVAGQVHVSAGAGFSISGANTNVSDGGEATHKLTVDEMPKHNHNAYLSGGSIAHGTGRLQWTQNVAQLFGASIDFTGGDKAHNIMQPYIVVNRWHRTA